KGTEGSNVLDVIDQATLDSCSTELALEQRHALGPFRRIEADRQRGGDSRREIAADRLPCPGPGVERLDLPCERRQLVGAIGHVLEHLVRQALWRVGLVGQEPYRTGTDQQCDVLGT